MYSSTAAYYLDKAFAFQQGLEIGNLRTIALSEAEYLTGIGFRFNGEYDKEFSGNETVYLLYEVTGTDWAVALQSRSFKSRDGSAEIDVLWNSTGYTAGTPEPSLNQNGLHSSRSSALSFSVISPPAVEGIMRETDFLSSSGAGNNSSGDLSTGSGSRIYTPGQSFILKVTNLENSVNRIHINYDWADLHMSIFTQ